MPRHTLTEPPPISFGPRIADDDARELQTVMALATHQVAALAADVEATVNSAIARLEQAVADAEARLLAVLDRL